MTEELRGVIDRFEDDLAAIVFDDDQRLDLPRAQLPWDAHSGDAIVVRLADTSDISATWKKAGVITFDDGQSIKWPGKEGKGEVYLTIEIDAEDTEARKKRVRNLLDDIFNKPKPTS